MPDPGRREPPKIPTPRPPRERRGNVVPLEGWVEPMRCPQCGAAAIDQVDRVEAVYPVRGVRRPWGVVHVDPGGARVDVTAVGEQFYRCRECESEWPVEPGTRFMAGEREA